MPAFRRVLFLRDELGDLVLPLLELLRFLGQAFALVVELDDAIHVGLDVAVVAVGFDGVEVFADEVWRPAWEFLSKRFPYEDAKAQDDVSQKEGKVANLLESSAVGNLRHTL